MQRGLDISPFPISLTNKLQSSFTAWQKKRKKKSTVSHVTIEQSDIRQARTKHDTSFAPTQTLDSILDSEGRLMVGHRVLGPHCSKSAAWWTLALAAKGAVRCATALLETALGTCGTGS